MISRVISSLCVCLFVLIGLATPSTCRAENVFRVGEKETFLFNESKFDVEDGILRFQVARTQVEDVDAQTQLARMRSEWLVNCYDMDSADLIETIREPATGAITYKYTCFKPTEADRAHTYAFTLDASGSLTDFSHLESEQVGKSRDRRASLRVVLKESLAATVALTVAVSLARRAYPGEMDKKLHAGASSLLASGFSAIAYHLYGRTPKEAAIIGAVSSCVVGAGKEVADRYVPGHSSSKDDFVADTFGCAAGSLAFYLTFQFD